jgi:hypothetical protein
MKIKMLNDYKHRSTVLVKDKKYEVTKELGNKLLRKRLATKDNFVTLAEKEAEKKKIQDTGEKLDQYPTEAKKIISLLRNEQNENVVEQFLKDKRKTVREAAAHRLEQLNE